MPLTAPIQVRTPCTCGASRWYCCTCSTVVAEYDCAPFDGIPHVPHPDAVVDVERQHAGMELLYIHLGPVYQSHLDKARSKRTHPAAPTRTT